MDSEAKRLASQGVANDITDMRRIENTSKGNNCGDMHAARRARRLGPRRHGGQRLPLRGNRRGAQDLPRKRRVRRLGTRGRSLRIEALQDRLLGLVRRIGRHYGDDMVEASFDATRARIATEPKLRLHVKNSFEYCGARLRADMEKYVADNEALIDGYLRRQAPANGLATAAWAQARSRTGIEFPIRQPRRRGESTKCPGPALGPLTNVNGAGARAETMAPCRIRAQRLRVRRIRRPGEPRRRGP